MMKCELLLNVHTDFFPAQLNFNVCLTIIVADSTKILP